MQRFSDSFDNLIHWTVNHGLVIILVLLVAWLARRFGVALLSKLIKRTLKPDHFASFEEEEKRAATLISVVRTGLGVVIVLIAGVMILSEVGVNVGPLVAGAGIVGVAVGFGGQWLIRDLIAGLFIILENQYRVGDTVVINGVSGTVDSISLRRTVLRDLNGDEHHVPNGGISVATNKSKEYSNVNLNVRVSYQEDLAKVKKIINQVGIKLSEDEHWESSIIEPPAFLRVEDFAPLAVILKITGKTQAQQQWAVTGELRLRLKIAFDKNNIEIPTSRATERTDTAEAGVADI